MARGATPGRRAAGHGRDTAAGRSAGSLPAPVQRRDAPARPDCDRAGASADAPDRRRADHRPRCHGAGPGARAASRAHRPARDGHPPDQPRSRNHGTHDAADHGDVRRPRGRVRADRRDLRPPASSVHRRAAPLDPACRRRWTPADTHRRLTTRSRPAPAWLPLRALDAPGRSTSAGRRCRRSRLRKRSACPEARDPTATCSRAHNPVAADEVEAGKPLRPGFRPAPPPEDELVAQETT